MQHFGNIFLFFFHERKQSDHLYCLLNTDELLLSHEKLFTIKLISEHLKRFHSHANESLACATAINRTFSELFSPKRVYVKQKKCCFVT